MIALDSRGIALAVGRNVFGLVMIVAMLCCAMHRIDLEFSGRGLGGERLCIEAGDLAFVANAQMFTWRRAKVEGIIKHRCTGVLVCSDLLCPVAWARCGVDEQDSFCADRRHGEYRYGFIRVRDYL